MAKPADRPRCSVEVARGDWDYGQCKRYAVVDRDGKHYCRQHDPVTVEEKRAAEQAEQMTLSRRNEELRAAAERRTRALGCGGVYYMHNLLGAVGGRYTGGVVLSAEECDALIARLAKVPR